MIVNDTSISSFSYETLINSISVFDEGQKGIVRDKASMVSIADKVVNGEADISKFVQAKAQVESYLDGYDFRGGFQFDDMNKKIGSLLTLRSKLATMADEAKKLSTYPDRYGSQRAVDLCRDLAVKCREKLRLEEAEKAIALAETNTQKLISIRGQFESDGDILSRIKEAIDSNMKVLGKFKAYLAEIQQYVDAFPHSGQDDLAVVNGRIETAQQINSLLDKAQKAVEPIKGYADRHNKNAIVTRFQSIVDEMSSKMRYTDVGKYKSMLDDIIKQAHKVVASFDEERRDLQGVHDSLTLRKSDIWKNDSEKMIEKIGELLRSDTKTRIFDLPQIKADITQLINNRNRDIRKTLKKYPWLTNSFHSGFHDNLVSKYISYSYYLDEVDKERKERNKKILKWVGIVAGAALALFLIIRFWPWSVIMPIVLIVLFFVIFK